MFQLTNEEVDNWKSQIGNSKRISKKHLPITTTSTKIPVRNLSESICHSLSYKRKEPRINLAPGLVT